ncbi:hypothetical protein ANO14919_114120 [Xylariales sp. No.14919]|nr:hypothetical protein ANO14919_114120 [Xylariales sp. No.14919]
MSDSDSEGGQECRFAVQSRPKDERAKNIAEPLVRLVGEPGTGGSEADGIPTSPAAATVLCLNHHVLLNEQTRNSAYMERSNMLHDSMAMATFDYFYTVTSDPETPAEISSVVRSEHARRIV